MVTQSRLNLSRQLVIGDVLTRWARKTPTVDAFVFRNQRYTYRGLNDRVNQLANALIGLGVGKQDRVAVLSMNSMEIIESYMALCKIGAVAVPLNFRLTANEIVYQLNQSGARTFIFSHTFNEIVATIRDRVKTIHRYICTGGKTVAGPETINYEDLLGKSTTTEPDTYVNDDDPAVIMYTSGTTGRPKGAVLTHKNILTSVTNTLLECGIRNDDRSIFGAPLFHIAALIHMLQFLYVGSTSVVMDKFEPLEMLKLIQDEKITMAMVMPFMWISILQEPCIADYDISSLRIALSGGSVLPSDVARRAMQRFPHIEIYNIFGQTEMCAGTVLLKPGELLEKKGSVGQRMVNVEARIVDNNNQDVPLGQVGEIVYRGPTLMREYYNMHRETAEAMEGGWFHSGDLVYEDKDNFIYVAGRLKDMIISGGENIYAVEVEDALFSHPGIAEAAVIGVPDPKWGESVKAIVVPMTGYDLKADEIITHCKKHLASYKKPKIVEIVESLPKTASGKVKKFQL